MNGIYVIVRPGGWGHVSDNAHAHLVVKADEWVQVLHKEKDTYDYVTEHTTFNAAHNERNRCNGIRDWVEEEPEPEVAVETTTGVQWLGERAA
jgi:hypothetical protein